MAKNQNRENIPANAYTHTCTHTYMYTDTYKMPLGLLKNNSVLRNTAQKPSPMTILPLI